MSDGKDSQVGRKLIKNLFEIYRVQPWLSEKEEEVVRVIDLCIDDEEIDLVVKLLKNFTYIDSQRMAICTRGIADYIVNELNIPEDRSIVVATAYDSSPDSSQMLLQLLKPRLVDQGWGQVRMCNQIGKVISKVDRGSHIILVDEFSGTGDTISKRVQYLKKNISLEFQEEYKIYVILVACMNRAVEKIISESVVFHSQFILKAGISESFDPTFVEILKNKMKRIEMELDQNRGPREFPSLGWGGAESLYAYEGGNVPNSVFPIFWWRWLASGKYLKTLFSRMDENFV